MKTTIESNSAEALVRKIYPVRNMGCAACAVKIENTLKQQKGVREAYVNFATQKVQIVFSPELVQACDLQKAIQNIGYDLVVEESSGMEDPVRQDLEDNLKTLQKKAVLALSLSFPVAAIGMLFMDMPYANEILWGLSTPVVLWAGRDFFRNAWKQATHFSANMDTLVALSTGIAYLFSVFNTLFPEVWENRGLTAHVYFEASAVIVAFVLLGRLLEERARGKTSAAIQKLLKFQPKTVSILEDGNLIEVGLNEVQIGDLILVKPGERIPVDGTVVEGSSYVDESLLTGEPLPVYKSKDAKVYAGTINQKGSLKFRAEKVSKDTILSQIIQLVQEAQGSKAPVQKLVDRISGIFVPVVLVLSFLTLISWNIFGGESAFFQGFLAMITVLVIACPCALGLATPTAIVAGFGRAAEHGILIKNAESLELARQLDTVVLDKTGTITEGAPVVVGESWIRPSPLNTQILWNMEKRSDHPVSEAILNYLPHQELISLSHFENIPGKGLRSVLDGTTYFVGNRELLLENHVSIPESLIELSLSWERDAKMVVFFSDSESILAMFAVSDRIKPSSVEAVRNLQKMGIEVWILTGDHEASAKSVAEKVGIQKYRAEILPEGKADFVKKLQSQGRIVAMVGDGINDSAALAQADIGIAMGKGSDIAIEIAEITILSSDLNKLPEAIRLSKRIVRTIRQNLFWAFIYNLIGLPVAAGILYPFNGFLLNPMLAGLAMALSSISVVGNSLRLAYTETSF